MMPSFGCLCAWLCNPGRPSRRGEQLPKPAPSASARSEVPVTVFDFMPTTGSIRMDYGTATSSLQSHSKVVKAVRQALVQQLQVPLEAVRVTLSPGSTLVHVQIVTANMQMASRVATLSAKAGGRSLLNSRIASIPAWQRRNWSKSTLQWVLPPFA